MESKITRADILVALKRANAYAELPFPSDMKWLTESIVNEVEKLINEKYSPTPQVQSGLSAEEAALAKYPVTYKTQFGQLDFDLNGYERDFYREGYQDALEYAASKVDEKEREITRMIGLLKGLHDQKMSEQWGRLSKYLDTNCFDYVSQWWDKYCGDNDINNIQQPDKL